MDDEYFREALKQSWVPGTEVTRFTRTWKLSAATEVDGKWLGHIGFMKEGDLVTVEWDESTKDFVRGEASSGVVVPFVVDPDTRLISFQLYPGEVRQMTVTGNLAALLNVQGAHHWELYPIAFRKSFEQWRQTVSQISSVYAVLEYPNPNWTNREKVEDLMEGLRAETVRIRARAQGDEGIDESSDWFDELMDHVRRGYGRAEATGPDKETGSASKFVETSEGGSVPAIDKVDAEEGEAEVSAEDLQAKQAALIESQALDIVVVDDDEAQDDTFA